MYDIENIKTIPIANILSAMGVEHKGKYFLCPNNHKTSQALTIYSKTNTCKCFNCGDFQGDSIEIVKKHFNLPFLDACKWISDTFNISTIENQENQPRTFQKPATPKVKKEISYVEFDNSKKFTKIELQAYLAQYNTLKDAQRLKLVYTYLYQFGLKNIENEAKKVSFYKTRGVPKNSTYLKVISYIDTSSFEELIKTLLATFPMEDLLEFKVFKQKEDGENVFAYKYINKGGLLLVPSFDLYSNMVTGFMVRPTEPPTWMKEKKIKELQLSNPEIIIPMPFGLTYNLVRRAKKVFITEGHVDLISIPKNIDRAIENYGVGIPGVNGLKDEFLSLFKDKEVVVLFDQDEAGQKSYFGYSSIIVGDTTTMFLNNTEGKKSQKAFISSLKDKKFTTDYNKGLHQKLIEAGVKSVKTLTWDKKYGKDINDLRINGNLNKIFE
ncbi:CHC2 zinc finger domain-containing protein [Aquamicrobium sp.]|uniref:CHC2 zinc finger domain-containing protein n=1 Tax=Aquamicrobium sp. TaxID=1872579 RepID=UPI00258F66FB|nr:CHC2 zinc finger domain-containing protein [Aquamicrobium sp.]MCK9553272.1 CHC2 zinc finger domain-containing protein [Aquamicrobium sp.]